MSRPDNTIQKAMAQVSKGAACWSWTGAMTTQGYGKVQIEKRVWLAHRLFYSQFKGEIPKGLQLDHLCRNRGCVNPDHLEAVSRKENILRGMAPTAINSKKVQCKSGHDLAGSNLYVTSNGRRQCRTCLCAAARKHRERKRHSNDR